MSLEKAFYKLNQEYLDVAPNLVSITLEPKATDKITIEEATKKFEDAISYFEKQSKKYGVSVEAFINGKIRIFVEKYKDNPDKLIEDFKAKGIIIDTSEDSFVDIVEHTKPKRKPRKKST